MLELVLLSIFFKLKLSNVYNQVNSKFKLRKFLGIKDLPKYRTNKRDLFNVVRYKILGISFKNIK
jgi:hypothetical protein